MQPFFHATLFVFCSGSKESLGVKLDKERADDIRTKHAFVWGDLNARNQPNAFSYGETWTHVTQPNAF